MVSKLKDFSLTSSIAYAVGLLVTDGCLSSDGRHIDISSVDKEQLENFSKCLDRKFKIGTKKSGSGNECFRIQFSDVKFYAFLLKIGLTPHKSKTIGQIDMPKMFFFDFLRGHFDGDGTFYSYYDPRWKNSFMFYLCFSSASKIHIEWLQSSIFALTGLKGSISKTRTNSAYQLKYAKRESLVLARRLYYNKQVVCLSRKRTKIEDARVL